MKESDKSRKLFIALKIANSELNLAYLKLAQDMATMSELTVDVCIEYICSNLSDITAEQHSHLLDQLL